MNNESGTATFQIILYEKDSSIKFNYQSGTASPNGTTFVGIENSDGTSGLRYNGLSSTVSNRKLAVLFSVGTPGPVIDQDGDGYTVAQGDCNDNDASIYPGATEICGDGIDNNCNGFTDENCNISEPDEDGDGYTVAQGDCNDNDASIYPGATEICGDGIDNNCNGEIDEVCNLGDPLVFYFPLISAVPEKIYFGLINNSSSENLVGSLIAYAENGELLEDFDQIDIKPLGQSEYQLQKVFPKIVSEIAYVEFLADSESKAQGYCRMADDDSARAAVYPAVFTSNDGSELQIPNLSYAVDGWSTEVAVLALSKKHLNAVMEFNNGASAEINPVDMAHGGGLYKFIINEDMVVSYNGESRLLGDLPEKATAAVVKFSSFFHIDKDKDLVIGAVLFSNETSMCAAALKKSSEEQLYVAHLATDSSWSTGLVLYNPGVDLRKSGAGDSCSVAFTANDDSGQRFAVAEELDDFVLDSGERKIVPGLEFPIGTQNLKIESECAVYGMEFMVNGTGIGCTSLTGKGCKSGVIASVQAATGNQWSAIALLNLDSEYDAEVSLSAYDKQGVKLATRSVSIGPASRLASTVDDLFTEDITSIATIHFISDKELSGLIVNTYDSTEVGRVQMEILPVMTLEER